MVNSKPVEEDWLLKRKALFRSENSINFFTHVLLSLGQSQSTHTAKESSSFCQLLGNILIDSALSKEADAAFVQLA